MYRKKWVPLVLLLCGVLLFGALSVAALAQAKKKRPAKKPAVSALVAAGKKVYEKNNCGACHLISGKGGKTGPELTKIGKEMKADQLKEKIRDPKKSNQDSLMPAFTEEQINEKDMKALLAYLTSLK